MIAWPGEVPGVLVVGWRSLDRTSMPRPFGVVALISADQLSVADSVKIAANSAAWLQKTPLTELDWTDFAGVPGWWTGDTTETNKSVGQTHKLG